jgi:MFS family permease
LAENVASSLRIGEGPDVGQLLKSVLPFFIAMQFAVYVSGPYFAPFMLKIMGLDYAQFMVLILLGFFGRVLILPWSGRIAQKFGPGKLMLWGAMGIVPMSTLWLGYHSFWWLCLIQLASGATWACYELAMSLVFIERIPSHHRVRVLSWFNTFNGLAMVGGAMLGGLILTQMENSVAGFLTLFLLSGIFRIVAFYWFPFGLVGIKSAVEMPRAIASQMSSPLLNGRSILRPFFVTSTNRKIGNSSRRV